MAAISPPLPGTAEPRVRTGRSNPGPIVVTSCGDPSSDGAVRMAFALASEARCEVELISVLDPAPIVAPEFGVLMDVPDEDSQRRRAIESAVATQLRRVAVDGHPVSVDVRVGDPTATIGRAASEAAARVIVLGLSHHDFLDRVLGTETAIKVARSADAPVLVVPRECTGLPRSALVAVDFSDASLRSARAAVALFPHLDELLLAHVIPPADGGRYGAHAEGPYAAGIEQAFDRFRDSIAVPPGVKVSRQIVRGQPARELLRIAKERGAALIVAGSHGRSALQRLFIGSVATGLLREATVPVLVLPARAGARSGDSGAQPLLCDPDGWPRALEEFSRRNTGRRAVLVRDDTELGARRELESPFLGCVFDPSDRRVAIMLGEGGSGSRHLVRGLSGVSELEILRAEDGRDRFLRIVHGEQSDETMLVFPS